MSKAWPMVRLSELLTQHEEYIDFPEARLYPKLSVKLYGKGVILDMPADGSSLRMKRHQLAKTGQVILSEIWGKKGAMGFVAPEGEGALCTSHFFLFDLDADKMDPRWLQAIFTANYLQEPLDAEAKGTTGYAAVRPKAFLACEIPLPPPDEQKRIMARIEELAGQIQDVRKLRQAQESDTRRMLLSAFDEIVSVVPRKPMRDVAPLLRRPVDVHLASPYPELGIRSFGNGTFHKPALTGLELGRKRIFRIEPDDLLFSNVFAWEGAIAVAKPEDAGRFGSHRFITCVPKDGIATSKFLCFYFLTDEGLEQVQAASPGGAGRNRTLGLEALARIEVPVPSFEAQQQFDVLQAEVDEIKRQQAETAADLDALLPAILDRAFKGKL